MGSIYDTDKNEDLFLYATYSGENPESLSDLVFNRNLPCADMPGFTEVTLSGPRYLSESKLTQRMIGR